MFSGTCFVYVVDSLLRLFNLPSDSWSPKVFVGSSLKGPPIKTDKIGGYNRVGPVVSSGAWYLRWTVSNFY